MSKLETILVSCVLGLGLLFTITGLWGGGKTVTPAGGDPTDSVDDGEPFILFVPQDAQLIAGHNEGVGWMGQYNFVKAAEAFSELLEAHPNWLDVKVNLAIAILNRNEDGDGERALEILLQVLEDDPSNLRAHYCSGLLKLHHQSAEEAEAHFNLVAEADPTDAYAAYYVGQCFFQRKDYANALTWYEKALDLDNFLRSAYYALSQTCFRLDQSQRAKELIDQFQKIQANPLSKIIKFVYTRMGPKSEVTAIGLPRITPREAPAGSIFASARELLDDGGAYTWNDEWIDRPASITACDINGDGRIDLFFADALRHGNDVNNALVINEGQGRYRLDTEHILAKVSSVNAALWGDYDNDGLTDVYLCRRGQNQLWRQTEAGVWSLIEDAELARGSGGDTVDGAMFDADHDGDLDIFCVNADGPNELINNNLDGTFRLLAQSLGIAGEGGGSRQVLIMDLDRDRDADIIVINNQPPHDVFINDRGWAYRGAENFDAFRSADIQAVIAADVDANGLVELYTIETSGSVKRWKGELTEKWTGMNLHPADQVEPPSLPQLAFGDVNGDGKINVLSSTESSWHVVSYQVKPGFQQPYDPAERGLDLMAWSLVNLDSGEGPSVVALPRGGAPMIWEPGPGRHSFVTLTFSGRENSGNSMRSNASGIGTHLAARIDSTWTIRDTYQSDSGPGQSLQPLALGIAGYPALEFIRLDWSDGLLQTELHDQLYTNRDAIKRTRSFAAGNSEHIEEIQRLSSSCPVLFAFNGDKYEFVSDFLGVAGLGYLVAPGEYAPARPWENLMLPEGLLVAREGKYELKIGEPMQETCYLDSAKLVQYDLPPGWMMTLDERMSILGPEPTGLPRFFRKTISPSQAINDRNEDVTYRIAEIDLEAAPVGEIDHRFLGRLKQNHVLTLRFEEPIESEMGEPMLIADGWIEYPYSQTMFAAWQAGAKYLAPSIEARGDDGVWRMVLEQFGYPAGMPRQMSVPLANLPPGTRELRITTNQEIYWDRLVIAYAQECPQVVKSDLILTESNLHRSGFARHTTGPQRQYSYDYDDRSPFWDTRSQRGAYTRFGTVNELVSVTDDALAIIGPGEEIHLEFAVADTELRNGWTRRFVLESAGWCKDMDLYTQDGETVGPLPAVRPDTTSRDRLHEKYNTRHVAGD